MMPSGVCPSASASSRSAVRPSRSPSMMRVAQALLDRPVGAVLLLDRRRR